MPDLTDTPRTVLIRNADIYAPESLGRLDLLVVNGKIAVLERDIDAASAERLFPELVLIDGSDCIAAPGLIDAHNHFAGAGGEGGPEFRTPPADISAFAAAGITGAVGLLGTDGLTRSLDDLLAQARKLDREGLSTWIYTGSYQIPSPTITGSVMRDIFLADKVIGVKMALSDHRSSHPSVSEILRLASDVRVAGLITGKKGVICVHLGDETTGLQPLVNALKGTGIPRGHFMPTHIGRSARLLEESIRWIEGGGAADLTTSENTPEDLDRLFRSGIDRSRLCMSTDGNGSMPCFDEKGEITGIGIGSPSMLLKQIVQSSKEGIAPLEDILSMCTRNVAECLGLRDKGRLARGFDGDVILLDRKTLGLTHVIGKGKILMSSQRVLAGSVFSRS